MLVLACVENSMLVKMLKSYAKLDKWLITLTMRKKERKNVVHPLLNYKTS